MKFCWSIDRRWRRKQCCVDDKAEKTQKMVWNCSKRSENHSKRLESRSKAFRKLYVFGWAHRFRLFWSFWIKMEFNTLILHVSVYPDKSRKPFVFVKDQRFKKAVFNSVSWKQIEINCPQRVLLQLVILLPLLLLLFLPLAPQMLPLAPGLQMSCYKSETAHTATGSAAPASPKIW